MSALFMARTGRIMFRIHVATVAALALGVTLLSCAASHAAVISFQAPNGTTSGGQTVAAKVTFTTASNQITVDLENLQADPRSVGQALSGLSFVVPASITGASLTSGSGLQRSIASDGSFTDGSVANAGWELSKSGNQVSLSVLGTPTAPKHTIIGPPGTVNNVGGGSQQLYANGNASITGNPHNPFLAQLGTFVLNAPGATPSSTISDPIFRFNTSPGYDVHLPEPGACSLGAMLLYGFMRRKTPQR
jgi:hypothetical protein